MTRRVVRVLPPTDAAYIAGIVDGEGTVTLTRVHSGEERRLVISVSNNDLALLRYLKTTFGAGKITSKRPNLPHHAPAYAFQISGRQALAVLHQIAPYLKSYKARRAKLILGSYVALTPRNGKYSATQLEARRTFEAEVLAIRP